MLKPEIEIAVMLGDLRRALELAKNSKHGIIETIPNWDSAENMPAQAALLRISYEGRCAEHIGNAEVLEAPTFAAHVAQFEDPDSWVHEDFPRWVRRALEVETAPAHHEGTQESPQALAWRALAGSIGSGIPCHGRTVAEQAAAEKADREVEAAKALSDLEAEVQAAEIRATGEVETRDQVELWGNYPLSDTRC